MGAQGRAFVLLVIISSTVRCTPLVNDLLPGQEWPVRESVKQPQDEQGLLTLKQTITDETISKPEKFDTEITPIDKPSDVDESDKEDVAKENPVIIGKDIPTLADNTNSAPEVLVAEAGESASNNFSGTETTNVEAIALKQAVEGEKVDYSGAQLWKVSTKRSNNRATIARLRRRNLITTRGGNTSHVDILIKSAALTNVTRIMKEQRIQFDVVIEDLQQRINEENPPLNDNELVLQDRRGHRMTWKQYHRLDDILGFMDYLAKTYPSIISVKNIGKSFMGRDLKVLRISDGKPTNKAVFIDGGIHAREWISPATVTYFINQIAENFDVESDDIKNIDWYFLPVLNPDGYEYTHKVDRLWRKNRRPAVDGRACIGTDLNRNFGYRWGGKGASRNPCSEIYRGSKAFSEPESQALNEFITSSAANFTAYLTYHSYGQYLLYPWGYDTAVPPDYAELDTVGKSIAEAVRKTGGSQYQVGSSSSLLYPASGGSDDWAKGIGIKYSYTIELSDTGRYGFVLPTSYIEPVAKESLAGLRVLAKQINKA